MKRKLTGSLLISILMVILPLFSEELRPYKLVNSDTLLAEKNEYEYITYLIGNVHFFYGDTEFHTDRAVIYEKQKITRMIGNVQVTDDSLSLRADRVEYLRIEEELNLDGNVEIVESHADSTRRYYQAESARYLRDVEQIEAEGNVSVFDERENLQGECGRLKYFRDDGYGYLLEKPVLSMLDKDSVAVAAEKMEYFQDFKKVAATFDVKVFSGEFDLSSDFLLYFADEDRAIFQGGPRFKSDFADARAREFQLYFDERSLIRADLHDSCRVDFSTDQEREKKSWAESRFMKFEFSEGELVSCRAQDTVKSYFHQDQTEEKEFNVNESEGEELLITVEENEISSITIKKGVSGKYKFRNKN